MKKVQFKLKNKTRAFSLAMLATLVLFTGCNSYDDEITDLQGQIDAVVTDVATLKTSVAALQTSVSGMTYIKSITMGTDGKLTITPSVGNAIVYDAKNYVTYDIKLEGNNLIVNGANKGSVVIPPLTFENGVLKSGTATVADLTSWMKSGLTVVDGFLAINGQKTTVAIPVDPGKTVKDVALDGTNVKVTYTDGTSTVFANVPFVASVSATTGNLVVNGVDTGVLIKNVYTVKDGFLAVNDVKTTVAIPADNEVVLINKVGDEIVSVTITDDKGNTITVKLNPTNELLSSILFVPKIIKGGINTVYVGYINSIPPTVKKVLFQEDSVYYRFNPTSADLSKTEWKFLNNSAQIVAAPGVGGVNDKYTLLEKPDHFYFGNGSGRFSLKIANWVEPTNGESHLFSLQADGKDFYSGKPSSVVSDYTRIEMKPYTAFIRNKTLLPAFSPYAVVAPPVPTPTSTAHHELYPGEPKKNLYDLVVATATDGTTEKKFEDYKFYAYKWQFTKETNYDVSGADNTTPQNAFIKIENNGDITIVGGTSALDRKPLIKVTLLDSINNNVIAVSWITFVIKEKPTTPPPPPGNVNIGSFVKQSSIGYQAMFLGQAVYENNLTKVAEIPWDKMNELYATLEMSHNQFKANYPINKFKATSAKYNVTVTKDQNNVYTYTGGTEYSATPNSVVGLNSIAANQIGKLTVDAEQDNVDTYAILFEASPYSKFGWNVIKYEFEPSDLTKHKKVEFTIAYEVKRPTLAKSILSAYQYQNATTIITQGVKDPNTNVYAMELYLGEAFGFGAQSLHDMFDVATNNKIDGAIHNFVIAEYKSPAPNTISYIVTPGAASTTPLKTLLGVSQFTGTKMSMNPANPLSETERRYPANFKTTFINGEADDFDYTIVFRNPLTIELAPTAKFNLTDIKTGAKDSIDVSKNYIIKMLGETIVDKGVVNNTNATKYGLTTATLAYVADDTKTAYRPFNYAFDFAGTWASWENSGTRLTSQQSIADVIVTYTASFAKATRTDVVKVDPDPTNSPVKRK